MSIYPTRTAAHLAIAGLVVFATGIALREPLVVAWGGAILVAVALARAVTLVSVMRIRAAGFEMLWSGTKRVERCFSGGVIELLAEVRNRDTLSARYDKLRVVASPALQTWVEPLAGEVPATGSVKLKVFVRALRVGYHGVYGLALEVRGAPGLFEVPLTFANPFGIEVAPKTLARPLSMPHGGRSATLALSGRPGTQRGDGTDLRELREHMPGDPFRRIAWKASAKRGKLVVKEFEREERDVAVLVVDASVELWAGPIGEAPLDRAIELAATVASHHIARGDLIGLRIVALRPLVVLEPDHGRPQLNKICAALMDHTGVFDADRCGWDESDLAVQVTEHLRPLDPRAVHELRSGRVDKLTRRAGNMRSHAPFARAAPKGRSSIDSRLRRYAACFGMHLPARLEPDRPKSIATMAQTLMEIAKMKRPRASVVHIVAPPPLEGGQQELRRAVARLRARRIQVRWTTPPISVGAPSSRQQPVVIPPDVSDMPAPDQPVPHPDVHRAVSGAVYIRAVTATKRGEQMLRRMGVKVVRLSKAQPIERGLDDSGQDQVA